MAKTGVDAQFSINSDKKKVDPSYESFVGINLDEDEKTPLVQSKVVLNVYDNHKKRNVKYKANDDEEKERACCKFLCF